MDYQNAVRDTEKWLDVTDLYVDFLQNAKLDDDYANARIFFEQRACEQMREYVRWSVKFSGLYRNLSNEIAAQNSAFSLIADSVNKISQAIGNRSLIEVPEEDAILSSQVRQSLEDMSGVNWAANEQLCEQGFMKKRKRLKYLTLRGFKIRSKRKFPKS